jgi:hypothetical protein
VYKGILSAVKRAEFVSVRMSYIILRGCWCHIIVLNIHAPTEDKIDDVKDSFYEELEHVFGKFLNYHKKILRDFNAKLGRKDIFKPTIGNESLYKISNDNVVRVANLPHLKISESKVKCSYITTSINIFGLLQMGKPRIRLNIFR